MNHIWLVHLDPYHMFLPTYFALLLGCTSSKLSKPASSLLSLLWSLNGRFRFFRFVGMLFFVNSVIDLSILWAFLIARKFVFKMMHRSAPLGLNIRQWSGNHANATEVDRFRENGVRCHWNSNNSCWWCESIQENCLAHVMVSTYCLYGHRPLEMLFLIHLIKSDFQS